jgi:hypothetical protein
VWEGDGGTVWPIEQFVRSLPFFSAILGQLGRIKSCWVLFLDYSSDKTSILRIE